MITKNHAASGSSDQPPIDLRRLQVFVCSANLLSFAACAQHLSLTPSAVSHAIRSLEEELACVLFQRHGPRVTLSRAGIRLLPIAEDLLARARGIPGEISSIDKEARQLRVAAPEFLCASLFPGIMPDFFECFPSFSFETVMLQDLEDATRVLEERRADLVISMRPELPGDFVRRRLFGCGFGFFVAPFHRLMSQARVTTGDFASHRLLVPHESVLDLLEHSGFLDGSQPEKVWVLPSIETVREFARVGLGVAVLGKLENATSVNTAGLQQLPYSGPPVEATCSAFWPGQNPLSWAAEAFLSFVEMADEA